MRNKSLKGTLFVLAVLMMLSVSCRPGRNISRENLPGKNLGGGEIIRLLEEEKKDFQTFKGRRTEMEIRMNGAVRKTRASIAIHRDSLILISIVPALGFEMARVVCSPDSVMIISRPDKTYAVRSFREIGKKYRVPVDFRGVQSLLLDELFYYGEESPERRFDKNISKGKSSYLFLIESFYGIDNISSQGYELEPGLLSIRSMYLKDHMRNAGMNVNYSDFQEVNGILFPMALEMSMMDAGSRIELSMKYGSIEFDQPLNAGFEYPEGYTKINMY